MLIELEKRGLTAENQILLNITYDGHIIPNAYRLDILVNKCVIVEIKVVEEILPVHISQVLTYLRFTDLRIGLIINFNKKYFGDAVRRVKRK
jgi:GxxExxY protein